MLNLFECSILLPAARAPTRRGSLACGVRVGRGYGLKRASSTLKTPRRAVTAGMAFLAVGAYDGRKECSGEPGTLSEVIRARRCHAAASSRTKGVFDVSQSPTASSKTLVALFVAGGI